MKILVIRIQLNISQTSVREAVPHYQHCAKNTTIFKVLFPVFGGTVMFKKKEILKQSCEDLFILAEVPSVRLIIGSDNIFNKEVSGTFAHIRV